MTSITVREYVRHAVTTDYIRRINAFAAIPAEGIIRICRDGHFRSPP